jgi:hypothetical protein
MRKRNILRVLSSISITAFSAYLLYWQNMAVGWVLAYLIPLWSVLMVSPNIYDRAVKWADGRKVPESKAEPKDVICPSCGEGNKGSNKFCPFCGWSLTDEVVSPTTQTENQAPTTPVEETSKPTPIVPLDVLPHEFISYMIRVKAIITKLDNKDKFFGQAWSLLEEKRVSFEHYMSKVKAMESEIKAQIAEAREMLKTLEAWKSSLLEAFNNSDAWVQDYELQLANASELYIPSIKKEQEKWEINKDIYKALIDQAEIADAKVNLLMSSIEVSFRKAFLRTLEEGSQKKMEPLEIRETTRL